jgi:2-iminobutanoate/2-iminopropanoate deaminase
MFNIRIVALILSIQFVAGCTVNATHENKMERKQYHSWEKDIGYSQVVRVGNVLHVSGVISDANTFDEQLQSIYSEIEKILADYGASTANIFKETIYTTDMSLLRAAIPLRKKHYPKELYPSSSWVQVTQLFSPQVMLEVEVTVQLPF